MRQAYFMFSIPELVAIKNKFDEMTSDKKLDKIEKPIEEEVLTKLGSILVKTMELIPQATKFSVPDLDSPDSVNGKPLGEILKDQGVTVETVAGFVNINNNIVNVYNTMRKFVLLDRWNYTDATKEKVEKMGSNLAPSPTRVKMIVRLILVVNPGSTNLIPEIKVLDAH